MATGHVWTSEELIQREKLRADIIGVLQDALKYEPAKMPPMVDYIVNRLIDRQAALKLKEAARDQLQRKNPHAEKGPDVYWYKPESGPRFFDTSHVHSHEGVDKVAKSLGEQIQEAKQKTSVTTTGPNPVTYYIRHPRGVGKTSHTVAVPAGPPPPPLGFTFITPELRIISYVGTADPVEWQSAVVGSALA